MQGNQRCPNPITYKVISKSILTLISSTSRWTMKKFWWINCNLEILFYDYASDEVTDAWTKINDTRIKYEKPNRMLQFNWLIKSQLKMCDFLDESFCFKTAWSKKGKQKALAFIVPENANLLIKLGGWISANCYIDGVSLLKKNI